MGQVCPHCYGVGYVIKPYFMATRIITELFRKTAKASERFVFLEISPKLIKYILGNLNLLDLMEELGKTLIVKVNPKLDYRKYKIKVYRNLRNVSPDELPMKNEKITLEIIDTDEEDFTRVWGVYQSVPVLVRNFKKMVIPDSTLMAEVRITDFVPYALLIADFLNLK